MATSYPGGIDSLPRPTASDRMDAGALGGPAVIDNISDAVEAIQTELGLDPAGGYATVGARLGAMDGAVTYAPAATGVAATDTAAIQALMDDVQNAPVSAGIIGRTIVFPPGEYVLNDTITMDQWSGAWVGQGVGNSPSYSSDPGPATVFRWAGASDRPMIKVTDSMFVLFDSLRLEGNDTTPPTYGIEFNSLAGAGAGTNQWLTLRRCWIGKFAWSSQGTTVGAMGAAVGFTGDNSNNDQFHIESCLFTRVGTGLYVPNAQSIWGIVLDSYFSLCTTAGIQTNASMTMVNAQFNGCAIDLKVTGSPRVLAYGWWSENSSQIYDLNSNAALCVTGGKWQVMSAMQGAASINAQNTVANDLSIRDVFVDYTITPRPTLYARGTYAVLPYRIAVTGCKGFTEADLDVRGYGTPGKTFVDIATGSVDVHTTATNKALSTYIAPQSKTGNYTLIDGESAPLIANGASITITLPDATACRPGATRFTVKNINATSCTVASAGGLIDGAPTKALAQWAHATFVTNGTDWFAV